MNVANAVGFFVLGTLMHVAPELAASLSVSAQPAVAATDSVRAMWLEFMSWVVGGVGSAYLVKEGVVRLPSLVAMAIPTRVFRPVSAKAQPLPAGAQVGISN